MIRQIFHTMRLLCFLAVMLFGVCGLWGCPKKKGDDSSLRATNFEGTIGLLPPTPSEGARVGNRFEVKAQLLDSNKLYHVSIWIAGARRWQKFFLNRDVEEKTLVAKVNASSVPDGEQKIRLVMKDHEGYKTEKQWKLIFDRTGPRVIWHAPPRHEFLETPDNVELRVKDPSRVKQVLVFYQGKQIHKLTPPSYEFRVEPKNFPAGASTFRIVAEDTLGNRATYDFTMNIKGSLVGGRCGLADHCEGNLLCIRTTQDRGGTCRQPCSKEVGCDKGFECRSIRLGDDYRACVPKGAVLLVGSFLRCNARYVCKRGLVCMRRAQLPKTCHPRCGVGFGACPKGYKCKDVKQIGKVCQRELRKGVKLSPIGGPCGPEVGCDHGGVCYRVMGRRALCYRPCQSRSNCSAKERCLPLQRAGGQKKICVSAALSHAAVAKVKPYATCRGLNECPKGFTCFGERGKTFRCRPKCKSQYVPCRGGRLCLKGGDGWACLVGCAPKRPKSCPAGLRCLLTRTSGRAVHVCR